MPTSSALGSGKIHLPGDETTNSPALKRMWALECPLFVISMHKESLKSLVSVYRKPLSIEAEPSSLTLHRAIHLLFDESGLKLQLVSLSLNVSERPIGHPTSPSADNHKASVWEVCRREQFARWIARELFCVRDRLGAHHPEQYLSAKSREGPFEDTGQSPKIP